MDILNQVCALEQAKMLKELGIVQESHFYWLNRGSQSKFFYNGLLDASEQSERVFSAYSVAELGSMLPFTYSDAMLYVDVWKHDYIYGWCIYENGYVKAGFQVRYEATEAQARAAMLIYLLEIGKVTAAECNSRLISA